MAITVYLALGIFFFAVALYYDKPRLSWKWGFLIPALIIWPYFMWDSLRTSK